MYRVLVPDASIECDTVEEALEVVRLLKQPATSSGRPRGYSNPPYKAPCPSCKRTVQGWRATTCKCGTLVTMPRGEKS